MPFYEYQCRACGAQLEVLQKITDGPLKKCPECAQNKLTKLVSAPVFRLKGGGWYETDFKSDKDNKRNLVDSDRGEGKAESKAEDKPGDKAAAKSDTGSDSGAAGKAEGSAASKPAPKPASPPPKRAKPVARRAARGKKAAR